MKNTKKILAVVLVLAVLAAAFVLMNRREKISCVYEAVFLDNEQVAQIFEQIRGEQPFEKQTVDFHVTTTFMPETPRNDFYGKPVTVHITGYKVGEVTADDGSTTTNEGLKAELSSPDEKLNAYLESLSVNFHITGSYQDQAKYTGYIDFSDAEPMDIVLTGTFGGYCSDNAIHFDPPRFF